jgi:hypothetical protein
MSTGEKGQEWGISAAWWRRWVGLAEKLASRRLAAADPSSPD